MNPLGLCTDLYELTMAQSYLEHGKTGNAVFSLFVRKLPQSRNFLVSCGLETLLEHIERFRFGEEEIRYLKSLGKFSDDFLDYLREYEFRGSLYAVPEGRVVFQNEPLVQVEGSLPEIQILETLVINVIHFQTVVASKAVRSSIVARGKSLVDFGFRRAHGLEAGIYAARASYVAGFAGTSNLEAGRRFGIPVFGTVAHSYIMVFDREEDAFTAFAESFPQNAVFLLDTYDTLAAVRKTVELARKGVPVVGVRLDSGDIESLAKEVRRVLDEGGLQDVRIIVSGGVDEYSIEEWLSRGVPIDAFGVGTKFITSADAPYLDMAYKLVEYEGKPKVKTSPGKKTFPFKRQVCRFYRGEVMDHDEVVLYKEAPGNCDRLVKQVVSDGRLMEKLPSLNDIRETLLSDIEKLPQELKSLRKHEYRVIIK
ncbi:nicotinate phosphoribosyltransferase [Hydrogenivirga sp.]